MNAAFEDGTPIDGPCRGHGGNVEAVSREYGIPLTALVDFSASINPFGPPRRVIDRLRREAADPSLLARYPDPRYPELRNALSRWLAIPPASLVIANGSAALYGAVVRSIGAATCMVPVPAFGEQRRALDAAGCRIERFPLSPADGFRLDAGVLIEAMTALRPAMCVLTNPHSPSGALTPATEIARVIRAAADCHTQLVVDEAFIDYAPSDTVIEEAARAAHVVVLRSLTKFYGMPALRVGYGVATPDMALRISAQLPEWPVSTLAANAGAEAVGDHDYARRTLLTVAADRKHLREQLTGNYIETYASAGNFLLLRLPASGPDSTRLRAALIRSDGIIVRDCRSFDGMADGRFIRVAVRARQDNARLVKALCSALQGGCIADR